MNILITGATGFVGTHIRGFLLSHTDWRLFGTSFPTPPPEALTSNREALYHVDLRDKNQIHRLLESCHPDFVIHLAAQSHVPTAYNNPWDTLENNILGQLNLLESCKDLDIKPRILIIGSSDEYGRVEPSQLPITEEHPLRPENPYSVSKVTQDVMGYQYYVSYGMPIIRVRPFNHVGPGQSARFVLPAFAKQIAEIEAGLLPNTLMVCNLYSARDFTDVRDIVRAYHALLLSGRPGEVYNIASGVPRTIQYLVDFLVSVSAVSVQVKYDASRYRPTDVPVVFGSTQKLTHDTGWTPNIPFETTMHDVLDEWRQITRKI